MKAWDVYLNETQIDTVFCDSDDSAEEVYKSLVNHDGYNSGIQVGCEETGESFNDL